MDRSIRCWDILTGQCRGILTSANGGHKMGVSCLELIVMDGDPASPGALGSNYIASGGADGDVIIWDTAGVKAWGGSHGATVTALRASIDTAGIDMNKRAYTLSLL